MLIYLIGYMGCGKTTAGIKLALKLGFNFIDLDEEIENKQNKSISQLFEDEGQDAFRLIEKAELHKTFTLNNTIVSTGGGAPCFFDNMEQMNKHGKTVYIQLSPTNLIERLRSEKDKRPLIANKTDDELLSFIENGLIEREPFYCKASHTIAGIGLTPALIENLFF
jgi:shikimate kinase